MKTSIALATLLVSGLFTLPALAQATPPAGWTCLASWYGTADGCDCGCGVADPDCADGNRETCQYNHCESGQVPAANPATCAANVCGDGYAAAGETCDDGGGQGCNADCTAEDPGFSCDYGAGGCHALVCGDGNVEGEETCDDGNGAGGDGCSAACQTEEGYSCRTAGEACSAVPAGWACNANYYGSGDGCDCGCGVEDADCAGGCAEPGCDVEGVCAYCYDASGASVGCASGGSGGDDNGNEGGPGDDNGGGTGGGDTGGGDTGGGDTGGGADITGDDDNLGGDVGPSTDNGGCAASTPADVPATMAVMAMVAMIGRRRRR